MQQLRTLADEYEEKSRGEDMDEATFEEYGTRCQEIVARQGGLHIAHVSPATREFLPSLCLRAGWEDAFSALATKGVPTYIFSSGYGDVVTQAIIQGGKMPASSLPQNVRIISNFFRTAPDGTVRAFSSPVIHERNKNAAAAEKHMGMPLPEREHALILGAHEDDVTMAEGAAGIKETLSVGFLELSEDLSLRLPIFMTTYDIVVIGDGTFNYVKQLITDILQLTPDVNTNKDKRNLFDSFKGAFSVMGGNTNTNTNGGSGSMNIRSNAGGSYNNYNSNHNPIHDMF